MNANRGEDLNDQERAVLAALEESLRADDPRLAQLLSFRAEVPPARSAPTSHPAGAPYWYWWRRRGQTT